MTEVGEFLEIELKPLEPSDDRPDRRRWVIVGVLTVLVFQFTVIGLLQAWSDSFTFDEPFSAASGSTTIREQDMRINIEHPPLPKVLAAIH